MPFLMAFLSDIVSRAPRMASDGARAPLMVPEWVPSDGHGGHQDAAPEHHVHGAGPRFWTRYSRKGLRSDK